MRIFKSYSLSNLQMCHIMLLTIVTMVYSTASWHLFYYWEFVHSDSLYLPPPRKFLLTRLGRDGCGKATKCRGWGSGHTQLRTAGAQLQTRVLISPFRLGTFIFRSCSFPQGCRYLPMPASFDHFSRPLLKVMLLCGFLGWSPAELVTPIVLPQLSIPPL